jgi:hypothetical protein
MENKQLQVVTASSVMYQGMKKASQIGLLEALERFP